MNPYINETLLGRLSSFITPDILVPGEKIYRDQLWQNTAHPRFWLWHFSYGFIYVIFDSNLPPFPAPNSDSFSKSSSPLGSPNSFFFWRKPSSRARCLSSTSEMTTSSSWRDNSAVVGVVVEGEHGIATGTAYVGCKCVVCMLSPFDSLQKTWWKSFYCKIKAEQNARVQGGNQSGDMAMGHMAPYR